MKNLIFSIAALLFTASSVAQLYVKPNGTDASYIYVKDEVLFVENDINLTANPVGATEASIYFRDGAQLIQGDAITSTNTGTGYISILQNNPGSDAWDYTYWSSPVGVPSGTSNQNFGSLRFFNPQGTKDAGCNCYLGTDSTANVPTTNFNGELTPDMRISSRWLYTYSSSTWSRIYNNSVVLPGRGFTMKGLGTTGTSDPNHDPTYDFRGRANNGNIIVPITEDEGTLSGNPYASALDLNAVFYDPDNTAIDSFSYWDEDRSIDSHY
jgi:hypothetical protein